MSQLEVLVLVLVLGVSWVTGQGVRVKYDFSSGESDPFRNNCTFLKIKLIDIFKGNFLKHL
jgi:hypothetical protein